MLCWYDLISMIARETNDEFQRVFFLAFHCRRSSKLPAKSCKRNRISYAWVNQKSGPICPPVQSSRVAKWAVKTAGRSTSSIQPLVIEMRLLNISTVFASAWQSRGGKALAPEVIQPLPSFLTPSKVAKGPFEVEPRLIILRNSSKTLMHKNVVGFHEICPSGPWGNENSRHSAALSSLRR